MTNTVRLRGVIRDPFYLEEREDGGTCYVTYVSVMRNSGIFDTLQVVVPASVLDGETRDCTGREVSFVGEFRSRNRFVSASSCARMVSSPVSIRKPSAA